MLLAVPGSGSAAPSPSVGFGISCPQGVRAGSDCRSIEQFSEASRTLCCHFLPEILEQGGRESFAEGLCWADTANQHREKEELARASRQISGHLRGTVGISSELLL